MNRWHKGMRLTALLAAVLTANPAVFQAQDVAAPIAAQTTAADVQVEQDTNGALYLDFKGVTLLNVLSSLSEVSKINFVAGHEIANREVNMSLDGVTLDQALQAIANGSNVSYAYMPDSNIILFRASSDAPQLAPLYTRVFKLYFLRASKIREIDAGKSSSGSSGSSSSGGGLELISSSSDKASQSVEAAILAIIEKMLSERGSVAVDDRSNSLIVSDTEDRLDRVATVIAELDRPLNQVLISVILVETFEDLDRQLGVEWANTTDAPGVFGTITGGSRTSNFPFNTGDSLFGIGENNALFDSDGPGVGDSNLTAGTKDFTSLNIQVKALQTASKLRILAKPNVLVMDNHPAIIKIVTNAAIGSQTVVTGGGGNVAAGGGAGTSTSQAERAEVGTILRVTPLINSQDQITMTIEPTFATVDTSGIDIGASDTGDPTVRAARTTLMVKSGSTLVMGGLMFSNQQDADRKTPFLADIPVIGRAFTSEQKTIQDRELVLFLSPQIIKNPAALEPGKMPSRYERFDDVNAQFWKYKKKTWYKDMKNPPAPPQEFEKYFQVRESAMDKMAQNLEAGKESAMSQDFKKAGQSTDIKWNDA